MRVPEQEHRRYLEDYLSQKTWEQGIPYRGTFELTPFCNLDCKMCYVHLQKEQIKGEKLLDVTQWKQLMEQAVEAGMEKAVLTGGECLTYPGFRELYLYLQANGVETSVYTNGILLDASWVKFFQNHPPAVLQISVYGSDENGYERVTGHRVYQVVMNHLKMAFAAGLAVRAAVTPSAFMGADAENIICQLAKEKIPYQINNTLFEPRSETGREDSVKDLPIEQYIKLFKQKAALAGVNLTARAEAELPPVPNENRKTVQGIRCAAGRNSFEITWRGEMRGCANLQGLNAEPLKDGVAAAWKKIHAAALHYPVPAQCEACAYREVCISCPAHHQQLGAPVGRCSQQVCKRTKRFVAEGLVPCPHCE